MKQVTLATLILSSLPALAVTEEVSRPGLHSARVVTCAIRFPKDSVKFDESQVQSCLSAVKPEAISYIHVIATADSSGSHGHNLYLSNRRAGAIEAFLTNRHPEVQIHAFGGGENPKFGKLARIFIVEHMATNDGVEFGPLMAAVGTPDIIETVKVETVVRTEYRDRPKSGWTILSSAGPAFTSLSDHVYREMTVEARKALNVPLAGPLQIGMQHSFYQSNLAIDIHASKLIVGRDWGVARFWGGDVRLATFLQLGHFLADGRALGMGLSGRVAYQFQDVEASLAVDRSNFITSSSIGAGIRL